MTNQNSNLKRKNLDFLDTSLAKT